MTILPPELFDETLDHLWDDPKTLQACCLTCRSWVPTARLHLFRTIRLSSSLSCTNFTSLLDSAPSIAWCVQKLTISASYCGIDGNENAIEDDKWVNSTQSLARCLGGYGRVNTLALSRLRWSSLEPATRDAFKGAFRSIKTLVLFEVHFHASSNVLEFLDAFPELEELYFHAVSWEVESDEQTLTTSRPIYPGDKMHLSYLFLDPRSSPTLVTEWILRHPSDQKLRTIQLCWREMDDTKALGDLLKTSGSSLERLRIEFPSGIPEEAVLANHVSLAHNTSLRALSFGGLDVSADTSRTFFITHIFPWITLMLSHLHSPLLREITFELETPDSECLRALDWEHIDKELSRVEFTGLTVRFYVNCLSSTSSDVVTKEMSEIIATFLPGFKERGNLCVSCI
ncbi:hypothetical protein BDY19DRAFT_881973 [Irpex rosettiformis]|uniref:Uncharacterized protein n=1 Tax=Irpex rosettiformis TaxID=378272 RepID=A0ACB8UHW6_9APHY|nr:hypothetical protein BDY19DRAFT_881973 [Irpex rosettiformis]